MVGMHQCWYCHAEIDEIDETVPVEPLRPPAARVRRPRRKRGAVVLTGVVAALLIAVGLLAFEAFIPKYTSTTVAVSTLDRRTFPDLGFSIAHPEGWTVVEDRYGVSFYSGERAGKASTRGFRVEQIDIAFKNVKNDAVRIDRDRYRALELLSTARGTTRAGEDAYKRVVVADDLRLEQWWIDRNEDVLRLEFWSRLADDEASAVNERLVKTLELR
jgi:hypothetical protein